MLSSTEAWTVAAVCEATKEMLLSRARRLVSESVGLPLLASKSCDGTPIRCQHWSTNKLPGGKLIRSRGKQGREVLVCNQFVRYQDPGLGWRTACILSEPVPLTKGKDVPHILSAAHQTWHTLRALGAKGCVVEHYCWDRAGITALERMVRHWHMTQAVPDTLPYPPEIRKHFEFVVITPCALHDSQNAFRWAYFKESNDRSLMRDIYISVESLRNSADLISSGMASWVVRNLVFVEERGALWKHRRRAVFEAMDVDPDVADVLVSLELAWEGGQLCAAQDAQVAPCIIGIELVSFKAKGKSRSITLDLFAKYTCEGWRPRHCRDHCCGHHGLLQV